MNFGISRQATGREVPKVSSHCPHLFCIDGALNLNNHQPTEQSQAILTKGATTIPMAAEVPFVKPSHSQLAYYASCNPPHPVASVTRHIPSSILPKDGRQTISIFAYPGPAPLLTECVRMPIIERLGFTGNRSDQQDYDLTKWIEKGKLSWVDPENEAKLMVGRLKHSLTPISPGGDNP
jgi:hypothetical protein